MINGYLGTYNFKNLRKLMLKSPLIFALFFLISCNTPEAKLERLQHEFWEKFARQDFFEIKLKNEVLHWPLPPGSVQAEQQKAQAEALQKEAYSIEKEKLTPKNQKQLAQICAALDDCVANAGSPRFDPSRCALLTPLKQYEKHPEFSVLLEKIPVYYSQIEQHWQTPDLRLVSKAVEDSQNALDLLNTLEEKSGKETVAQTRGAIKDFIGLCQSAYLLK